MDYPKIVLFGNQSKLGKVFKQKMNLTSFGREVDITDFNKVILILKSVKPKFVINCAAYNNVDKAEYDNKCFDVNGIAPQNIANVCNNIGAKLIQFSSNFVFDGSHYNCEYTTPNPISRYGESKLMGEQLDGPHFIIRTSWLFDKEYIESVKGDILAPIDMIGCPTYIPDLVDETIKLLDMEPSIYHITNSGPVSKYDFLRTTLNVKVGPTSLCLLNGAKRPKNGILVNTKIDNLREWTECLPL